MATAVDGQFCLDVGVSEARAAAPAGIDTILATRGGDAPGAIRELPADADFPRDQLYTASQLMSRGIGYGWRPSYERV